MADSETSPANQLALFELAPQRKTYADGVYSAYLGDNSALIEQVVRLYTNPGDVVVDATFGKGAFWRSVDVSQFDFRPSDLLTVPGRQYDFRHLPYENETIDVVVLDPPYAHNPGTMIVDANYRNAETTGGMYHDDISKLYADGMKEAARIVKPGGFVWVKGQDEIESGYQRWSHVEHLLIALKLGLFGKDLFVLVQDKDPVIQGEQQHSRKKHSYLWVFKKPEPNEMRALARYKVFSLAGAGERLLEGT